MNGYRSKRRMRAKRADRSQGIVQARVTICFPPDAHATLEMIVKQKKVSLAWVVRLAAERYLAEKWPLFKEQA
jgi:hypothetical protein